jgi:hypothetical protein
MSRTVVSIEGDAFHLNGRPTYPGRSWKGRRIEGLLLNARLVQGAFDDRNPETRPMWDYPDGPWDPQRNTREFIDAMGLWRDRGLVSFTINFQGGSPQGYSREQPWHNSAFEADGTLRDDYAARMGRILDRADELEMAPILGVFYFGQDHRLADEQAVGRAMDAVVDWLIDRGDRHVLVEIANEINVRYTHEIIQPGRCHELIRRVGERSSGRLDTPAGRLLVGTSMGGGAIPPGTVVEASDFVLLHGNGVGEPDGIRRMVREVRAISEYRGQPVVFNEDDHFDFEADDCNMLAAVDEYAGWGYFDYRMAGEGFDEGYQSVPVNWSISSRRKRGFFDLLAEMTGSEAHDGSH